MEYAIGELAQLAGVSTRTLRWYHQMGLLSPVRTGENGYRFYGEEEVDRLQQILLYRTMGVELDQIRRILDDPSFRRLDALEKQLDSLQAEQKRVAELIALVKATISAAEGKQAMSDEEKFEAIKRQMVEENEARYGQEVRKKYGQDEVEHTNGVLMGMTQEQYEEWTRIGEEIQVLLETAVNRGQAPESETGKGLTCRHNRWLSLSMGKPCDEVRQRGIAQLYVEDPRFQAHYDEKVSGCARFLRDAVTFWTK